ncbi:hypothetical protein ACS0TY_003251 [Phlomoides rotata]
MLRLSFCPSMPPVDQDAQPMYPVTVKQMVEAILSIHNKSNFIHCPLLLRRPPICTPLVRHNSSTEYTVL